jgi:hypothetical protein
VKVWFIAIVSLVVGAALGLGSVWVEFGTKVAQFEPHNQRAGATIPRESGPKAAVAGSTEYDFKVGQRNSKMKHTFVIRNVGDEPLTLEKGETTCKCTLSELEDGEVPPGGSANVLLDWKLETEGTKFRQSAMIRTNDPNNERISLSIFGTVVDLVKLEPSNLVITSAPISEETAVTFLLLGYKTETMAVKSHEFVNKETDEFFDLTFEEASVDVVKEHENAKCGLVGTLTIKPGLPLGPINQTIHIVTDVEDVGTLDMSVAGSVVSDISILGTSKFHPKASVLDLGTVDRNEGIQEKLRILVKGPYRGDVKFEIVERDPDDVLAAWVDEPKLVGGNAVYMHTLNIEIAKDSRRISCLGTERSEYGKIILTTTHPEVKTIPIYVRFSVR